MKIKNSKLLIQGCPGIGKTKTSAVQIWLLLEVDYKILLVASSNGAVDASARAVLKNRPTDMSHKKLLRLEIAPVEPEALVRTNRSDFTKELVKLY